MRKKYSHHLSTPAARGARCTRRLLCGTVAALALLAGPGALAQDGGKGRLTLVVPLAAGSTTDTVARLIAEALGRASGLPVVVLNRPGASGRIAAAAFKDAAPDGTTLMLAPMAVTVLNPLLYRKLPYDPVADFAPVAEVARFRIALAVAPQLPAASLADFLAWARGHPGRASCGIAGAGGLPHLYGLMLAQASGVDLAYVPYSGGAQAAADLASGQLACELDAMSTLIAWHRAARLRIVAVSGTTRAAELPAVATFAEQGYPALDGLSWLGLYAPARTPQAQITRLAQAVEQALQSDAVRRAFAEMGLQHGAATPQALAAAMVRERRRWGPVIDKAGLGLE